MLMMILADAELELVPQKLWNHPSIIRNAKKRKKKASELLLDSSIHSSALGKEDRGRRGRPDIVYSFLSLCLDSIANLERKLITIVHTRNNDLIRISPSARLPISHHRFVGLMERLFDKGAVPQTRPKMILEEGRTLEKILESLKPKTTISLSPDGEFAELTSLFKEVEKPVAVIIGGFPEGDYLSPVSDLSDRMVSISPHLLKVWTVVSHVLVSYNQADKTYK